MNKNISGIPSSIETALADEKHRESLELYQKKLMEFNALFCEEMFVGNDFSVRLELKGNRGKLLHVRTYKDSVARPRDAGSNSK